MRGTGDLAKVSATTCEKTAEIERCGKAAVCKKIAKAKLKTAVEWWKCKGPCVKGKGPCEKGLRKANGMLPETAGCKKRQGDGCHKGPFARREKAKAGNRRPCKRGAA